MTINLFQTVFGVDCSRHFFVSVDKTGFLTENCGATSKISTDNRRTNTMTDNSNGGKLEYFIMILFHQ
jgi:hypothetical protein